MNIFEKFRAMSSERKRRETEARALSLFQLCESDGNIWLTYDDKLVCPASMLKDEPVLALNTIRRMYIERTIAEE